MSSSSRPTRRSPGSRGKAPVKAKAARKAKTPARPSAKSPAPSAAAKAAPSAPPPTRPPTRFGVSSSSRLTIKPGPPGLRPSLERSTKTRPSGPRPLSEVLLDEDEVLIDGFEALLRGDRVQITAVLERTCVYVDRNGDRRLARKEDLVVEADRLPILRRGVG